MTQRRDDWNTVQTRHLEAAGTRFAYRRLQSVPRRRTDRARQQRRRTCHQASDQSQGLAAFCLDEGNDVLRVLFLVGQIGNGDIRPLTGIGDRGGTPDTRISASDQGFSPFELARTDIAVLAVVRFGVHFCGNTRCRLRLLWEGRLRILCARILQCKAVVHERSCRLDLARLSQAGAKN